MDVTEASDQIVDTKEESTAAEKDRFRSAAALLIALLAMLLAINSVGGGNAVEDMIGYNIKTNDLWAFYQAKNIRQTDYKLAADELKTRLVFEDDQLTPEERAALEQQLADYQQTIERYESEPDPNDPETLLKGEGKQELKAQAHYYETLRDKAMERDPYFDMAEALYQIAIVLASVSILINSRWLLGAATLAGLSALLLTLNGFFLIV
jgi:hypothetical protein